MSNVKDNIRILKKQANTYLAIIRDEDKDIKNRYMRQIKRIKRLLKEEYSRLKRSEETTIEFKFNKVA